MNPSTAFGAVFVDELIRCGLRDAVLAPGSRSAPLAMALFDRAAASASADGRAGPRLHVRIDERSAAFLGLGLAKASSRPVVLVCTSGTAAAHFHAAVIEADEAGVPLIVLTADRPPELRGTGTSQTIDQIKLYGGAVRWFCEAGVPEERAGMVRYWRSLACRAWAMASGGAGSLPGPVHVNLPFRDPLVPGPAGDDGWPEPLDGRPDGAPWTSLGDGTSMRPRRRRGAAAGLDRARGGGVRRRGLRSRAPARAGRSRRVAGAGRAVVERPARPERPVRLWLPARLTGIRCRSPARSHRFGRAARPVPRPAWVPARSAGSGPGPARCGGPGPGPVGRFGQDRY